MKKKSMKIFLIIFIILFICIMTFLFNPLLRVKLFVALNKEEIENSIEKGLGISSSIRCNSFNTWEGKHTMTEFILFSLGNTYYGCYYSPDDVSLAFQNFEIDLIQKEKDIWTWNADGDNKGKTIKIVDKWYYFEVSL